MGLSRAVKGPGKGDDRVDMEGLVEVEVGVLGIAFEKNPISVIYFVIFFLFINFTIPS